MRKEEEEEGKAITGIESNGAHLYFCRCLHSSTPTQSSGIFFFFLPALSVSHLQSPFSLTLCAYVFIFPATYRPSLQKFRPLTFTIKKGKNNNKDDGMRLPPPLSLLLDLFISPEMKWSIRMMTITWKPSKREHREWIFNRGLTSCCCYLFLYCCPPPLLSPNSHHRMDGCDGSV